MVSSLVDIEMVDRKDVSVNRLFELYSLMQEVMRNHLLIEDVLCELSEREVYPENFQSIEVASNAILEACNQIESVVEGKKCHQCCCQT